ncbi:prepilin-type N-terminal cleavage/methylation domain-containing protein [Geothrix sp. PMB-07]|uniref:type IV pilus modification PilV family protein n=1 Tax=Geothrix sp. PMB-07 TaxID=3068640 RepID=UPI0027417121|nr:prepilin-type N-terminal cleavage/methylation domain-containing protein [Geothrix sp. PMB-07]WLT32907.1 prepilin-type N-terminal cleavage/methylation domain-containing protein [Geothrix sp. PMB-07]
MNTEHTSRLWRTRQYGFSMIEFLITAFVLAVGVLGLALLQVMSIRSSSGSRALNTAVMVGEGVLESIQSEGRQRMLFLKFSGTAPATTYFGPDPITQYYAFDGTLMASSTNSFFTAVISSVDVVAISAAGGTKRFTLVLTYTDTPNPANPTATITRTVTLTRQVAYA